MLKGFFKSTECYIITFCFNNARSNQLMSLRYLKLKSWFLAALILFGQSASFAHQFSHDILASDNSCVNCLAQSVFSGAITAYEANVPILHGPDCPVSFFSVYTPVNDLLTPDARAPPAISL